MRLQHLAILALAALGGACAAAVPGYQPPDPKTDRIKAAAPTGGGFDQAGNYSLTDQERGLDCKALNGSITIKIIQMRDRANRSRPSGVASVAQATARPLVGGTTYGQDIDADYRRDRARLETLNRQLAARKCPTYDLEAELRPGNMGPPQPIKPAKAAPKG